MTAQMLKSSYLFIGEEKSFPSLGADYAADLTLAKLKCKTQHYGIIVIPADIASAADICAFANEIDSIYENTQYLLLQNNVKADVLRSILSSLQVFRIVASIKEPKLESYLAEAQENFAKIEQGRQLFNLLNEQNESLLKLSRELEDRVAKRQQNTIKARQKLLITNQRTEALQRALIALNRAKSVGEIEVLVKDALADALEVEWIRIHLLPQIQLLNKDSLDSVFIAPLYQGSDQTGHVYFGRAGGKFYSSNEENFLAQVAESISLAIFRMNKQRHFETLKQQWEATFDAITRPLHLVDNQYNIVRSNRSFAEKTGLSSNQVSNRKCYEVFFKRQQPCINCHLGKKFRLAKQTLANKDQSIFEVTSQALRHGSTPEVLYINIYNDLSATIDIERQIVESTKSAEIGLIGSSIAHELNNPLAGIISFIQIIKMDSKAEDVFYNDILEMESAAMRCKEIISNLLGFSRSPQIADDGRFDMREVIIQSKQIFELRTKSRGIEVSLDLPEHPAWIEGQFNLLTQALGHLITMAFNSLTEQRKEDKNMRPKLLIKMSEEAQSYIIDFSTDLSESQTTKPYINTSSLKDTTSLDLQVTSQIIKDHLGQLDIISLDKVYQARVKFARPENQAKSQEVDGQI